MMTEKIFFYYERSRKQQAKVLLCNMFFLPVVLWFFLWLIKDHQAKYDQFYFYAKCIFVAVEIILMSILIWFITHPATFFIKLTNLQFSSFHPIFTEWTFSVDPEEIIEIKHSSDREAQLSIISINLQNGSSYLLSPNYAYSRSELYKSLLSVNPKIKLPKNSAIFPFSS